MKIIYTPGALRQLDEALDYIEARSPQGAQQVKASIRKTIDMLSQHPLVGRVTNVPGQRRIVVSRCPYAIFYRCTPNAVVVLRVRHTARKPTVTS